MQYNDNVKGFVKPFVPFYFRVGGVVFLDYREETSYFDTCPEGKHHSVAFLSLTNLILE